MNIWLNFLVDSLAFGATFMYGSTGEILTEKAGHLNLGIPGIMCMGGAGGCLVLNLIGKSGLPAPIIVILGILGSLAAAMRMGLIYSFLTVTLRANQNVTGLALTTFGAGLDQSITTESVGGQGFTAIMVSWLAKFDPLVMLLTAGLISLLNQGAAQISQDFNVSGAFPDVIVGIILFFIIGSEFFITYQIIFTRKGAGKEAVK